MPARKITIIYCIACKNVLIKKRERTESIFPRFGSRRDAAAAKITNNNNQQWTGLCYSYRTAGLGGGRDSKWKKYMFSISWASFIYNDSKGRGTYFILRCTCLANRWYDIESKLRVFVRSSSFINANFARNLQFGKAQFIRDCRVVRPSFKDFKLIKKSTKLEEIQGRYLQENSLVTRQ